MTDIVDTQTRSRMMAGIKSRNTKPEMLIRKGLHKQGFRYRLHDKVLPGRPDILLPKYRTVIMVNGCFWHKHECKLFKWPSTRPEFWREKLNKNSERDKENIEKLRNQGWRVLVLWECALKNQSDKHIKNTIEAVTHFISSSKTSDEIPKITASLHLL